MGRRYEVDECRFFDPEMNHFGLMDTQLVTASGEQIRWKIAEFQNEKPARHTAACLNALDGIPDPAAFVEAARKVVEAHAECHDDDDDDYRAAMDPLIRELQAALGNTGKAVG